MDTIPSECILTDGNSECENNHHPVKLLAKDKDYEYKEKIYPRSDILEKNTSWRRDY